LNKKQNLLLTFLVVILAFSLTGTIVTFVLNKYVPYLFLLLFSIVMCFVCFLTGRKLGQVQKRTWMMPIVGVIGVVLFVWHSLDLPAYYSGTYAVVSGHPTITKTKKNSKSYKVTLGNVSDFFTPAQLPFRPDYIDYVKYYYLPHTKMIQKVEWK
jgi:hypothetical protein